MDKTNALERDKLKKKYYVDHSVLKADMHIHISMAYSQGEMLEKVKRASASGLINIDPKAIDVDPEMITVDPEILLNKNKAYYPDLLTFHKQYESLRPLTKPEDLKLVTQGYLENFARQGGIYAEISNSFRDEFLFEAQLEGIVAGIEAAHRNTGIDARIIMTTLRDFGPKQAMDALNYIKAHQNPYVTGFGLVGNEFANKFIDFEKALNVAFHEAGLGITPHIGEQGIEGLVDYAEILTRGSFHTSTNDHRRIRGAHGVLMYLSPKLIDLFNQQNMAWEIPLSAHKSIDLPAVTKSIKTGDIIKRKTIGEIKIENPLRDYFKKVENHPLMYLKERGVKMMMGSDNPFFMNTSGGKEYSLAVKAGWKKKKVHKFTENAIDFANTNSVTRFRLKQRYNEYVKAIDGKMPPGFSGGYVDATDLDISFE